MRPYCVLQRVGGIVTARLRDESRLVRAEALDLLGTYIQTDASLATLFMDVMLEKLQDDGISVRKKAALILRELLLRGVFRAHAGDSFDAAASANAPPRAALPPWLADAREARILLALLQRYALATEESSVQELVASTFGDYFFGSEMSAPPTTAHPVPDTTTSRTTPAFSYVPGRISSL
ncbi:MAG: hypothetical protein EOO65_04755 [Methanosarcinales archaeon]|nr:MAG: hypothetical protein EOO65_04755 [Methanosarcinales archaeon]